MAANTNDVMRNRQSLTFDPNQANQVTDAVTDGAKTRVYSSHIFVSGIETSLFLLKDAGNSHRFYSAAVEVWQAALRV